MILWDNNQDKVIADENFYKILEEVAEYSLKDEGVKIPYELSITLVDNETIRDINNKFRKIDKVTDVLSFPMLSYAEGKVFKEYYCDYTFSDADLDDDKLVLGDIVLSLERAREQSIEFNHEFLREACYLTLHSILHLLGYDHMNTEDKARMRKREEEILKRFDLSRGTDV